MIFKEQIIATSIGTFFGFVGSLILFWTKEFIARRANEKNLIKNLGYELDYNITLYKKWIDQITKCIEATSAEDHHTYLSIDYQYIARFFSIQFYQSGTIQNYLHHEDMKRWNDFLISLNVGNQAYVLGKLAEWRNSRIAKDEIFKALDLERDQIKYALEMTLYIKSKIKA